MEEVRMLTMLKESIPDGTEAGRTGADEEVEGGGGSSLSGVMGLST